MATLTVPGANLPYGGIYLDHDTIKFIGTNTAFGMSKCTADTITATGHNQSLTLSSDSNLTVTDKSQGLLLTIYGCATMTVQDFAADRTGKVHLALGVPATFASDHHGGTILSGQVDFVGMSAKALAARIV